MARPRSDDPKKPVSLSLRASTFAAIEERAKREHKTPQRFLAEHIERRYGANREPDRCNHPRAKERRLTLAGALTVICGQCGKRLR